VFYVTVRRRAKIEIDIVVVAIKKRQYEQQKKLVLFSDGTDMDPLQIAKMIEENFPGQVFGSMIYVGQVGVMLKKDMIKDICRYLRDEPALRMNHLADLTAVDFSRYPGDTGLRFEVVYNLISIVHRHRIRLKVRVPEEDARVDSVSSVWQTANWHERETYDLMGIKFEGHPDLRRILTPDDFEGYPLRKEFPVKGY
jgi:NADH-quinone oxidoreductase subunit C